MAVDKLVDSTQLDSDLTDVADEIRTAGGTLLPLSFPDDYVVAIGDIGNTEIKTASGSIAHFEDALARKAQDLTVAIEPIQDLHGYDNPWPAGGGKNKFPITLATQTKNGTTFTVSSDGAITISGTPTAQTRVALNSLAITPDANMAFSTIGITTGVRVFVRANNEGTISYPTISPSVTLSQGVTYDQFYLEVNTTFPGTATTAKFQLESGSTATDWTPYSNICPISGWTGANVTRTGVNVWDEEWEAGYIGAGGQNVSGKAAIRSKNYIPIKPSTTYFYANGTNGTTNPFFYDADKNFIGRRGSYLNNQTFTTPANAHYMRMSFPDVYGNTYKDDISINCPSTDHAYHPYSGTTHSITFPSEAGTVYGGTLDVTTGKLTVDRAMVDLGTMTWHTATAKGYTRFWARFTNIKRIDAPNTLSSLMCSYYQTKTANETYNGTLGISLQQNSDDVYIYDPQKETMSTADFKTAMSGAQLVYELATPTVYDLTPTEVTTLLGTNNVWADTGDSTIKYIAPKAQIPSAQGVYF